MWPFKRKLEPKVSDDRTPISNMIEDMLAAGLSWDAILLFVRSSEQNAFRMLRIYQLDRQVEAVREHGADKRSGRTKADTSMSAPVDIPADRVDMVDKKRQRWKEQKKNQRLKIVR